MNGRIKRGEARNRRGNIPPVPPWTPSDTLRFSFKYLDLSTNPKFGLHHCGNGYLEKFLDRLRGLCTMTVEEFRTNRTQALRSHEIDFEGTTEPDGFTGLNAQLRAQQAWQFQLTANEHGRVHGLINGHTFYIVWIDPAHKLYE